MLRAAKRLFASRRAAARSKVAASMIAGTGMAICSSGGRSLTVTGRGVARPSSRARRLSAAFSCTAMVLPNTAWPA